MRDAEAIKLPTKTSIISDNKKDLGFIVLDDSILKQETPLVFMDQTDIAQQMPTDLEMAILCGFPTQLAQPKKVGKIVNISIEAVS